MNLLFGWLCLATIVRCAWAGGVTAPPYVEPETGPPKDKSNCRINVRSVLPWMVAVWDAADKIVVGHGSMLTYITFITTCRQYKKPASKYRANGQFIWNASEPFDPCMQQKEIGVIFKHPKCTDDMADWSSFDFAVFRMKKAFDIAGFGYPTISLYNNHNELSSVKYLNWPQFSNKSCSLISFRSQEEAIPTFNFNSPMQVVPFKEECMKLLCEKQPADPSYTATCQKQFKGDELDTFICMKNKSDTGIQLGRENSYWLAGAPLQCDTAVPVYGIASQPKIRKGYSTNPTDIHYIVPFFRVWNWIEEHQMKHSAPWGKRFYLVHTTSKNSQNHIIFGDRDSTFRKPLNGGTYSLKPIPSIIGTLICILATVNSFPYQKN